MKRKLLLVVGCSFSESKGGHGGWIPWKDIATKEI